MKGKNTSISSRKKLRRSCASCGDGSFVDAKRFCTPAGGAGATPLGVAGVDITSFEVAGVKVCILGCVASVGLGESPRHCTPAFGQLLLCGWGGPDEGLPSSEVDAISDCTARLSVAFFEVKRE